MSVLQINGEINIVRLSTKLIEFPALLKRHLDGDPETPGIEQMGEAYIANGFQLKETKRFVQAVCAWGNYPGVGGKVLKHNDLPFIRRQLKKAYERNVLGKYHEAIIEVTKIKCLAVSFGSKHLKFLNPDRAVVLDSIISERLGYSRTPSGYAEFLKDCMTIRNILNSANIIASKRRPDWRVSDVEMAIFKSLRK